ncbi:putative 2-dehydro-3-deoxyphosphooctonate aldolase [Pavlovales sp. CCMP2436]|nr:putative 2-dehydro-3-deoxyphosphooctonate aldolase [Pavlovales sp. CCMP2436]
MALNPGAKSAAALFARLRGASPFFLISGPCALESLEHALFMSDALASLSVRTGIPVVYKTSFDKANRTSAASPRGLGLDASLRAFEEIKRASGLSVITDVHECWQVAPVAEVVDVLQIPAFLCRQTDLLVAAAHSGLPVNVKKGQFASAGVMGHAAAKLRQVGGEHVMLTERGTTFGYDDLVVDCRNLELMREAAPDALIVMDATHAVQSPPSSSGTGTTGGGRRFVPTIARMAAAVGVDGFFLETHDRPEQALSDAAVQLPLEQLEPLVLELAAIARASNGGRR